MSIQDLRARLRDIPGAETLSMGLEGGRIILKWGDGYSASVDGAAPDADIEAAVRNAVKLPPISIIPDKTAAPAPATMAQPITNPADAMKAFDDAMTKHAAMMADLASQQVAAFEAKLSRQRASVTNGFGAMGVRIDEQTDAFEAMMARLSNGGPA